MSSSADHLCLPQLFLFPSVTVQFMWLCILISAPCLIAMSPSLLNLGVLSLDQCYMMEISMMMEMFYICIHQNSSH